MTSQSALRVGMNALFLQRPYTGTGQYLLNLVKEFGAWPDRLLATMLGGKIAQLDPDDLEQSPARAHLYGTAPRMDGRLHNVRKLLWEQARVPLLAYRSDVDLLHCPYWASPLWSPVPSVVTIHDVIPALFPTYRRGAAAEVYTRLVSLSARRADAVIVDSVCSRDDVVRVLGVRPERVHVVYLAASGDEGATSPTDPQDMVARQWGLQSPFFLYVGATDLRKDLPTLLRAWARAASGLAGFDLVVAGHTPPQRGLAPDLEGLSQKLGIASRVRMLGSVGASEKRALLKACCAFVFPSRYEGFGLPPLEAMAAGAAVIAARASSVPEVVGDAGLTFPAGDDNILAELMIRVASDGQERTRLRSAALDRARRFSWRRTAEQTLCVYESLRIAR